MDERRFDDLTRAAGRATTRRAALKGLLGGLAATLLPGGVARDPAPAEAAPAPAAKPPPPCDNATQAQCDKRARLFYDRTVNYCANVIPTPGDFGFAQQVTACSEAAAILLKRNLAECRQIVPCNHANCEHCTDAGCQSTCIAPATCNGSGTCICPGGQTACGGRCFDLKTDNGNCGTCGHACPAGSTCVAGVCCVGAGGTCKVTSDCCFGQCSNGKCCLSDGGFCASGGDCCSGICTNGRCGSSCPTQLITVRGEQCCLQPPASYGLGPTCGPFTCAYGVTGTGPGGCDLWCDNRVEHGAGCGPKGDGTRQCCCNDAKTGAVTFCVPS